MNLATKLAARAAEGRPVTVGLIGAGKFGTMFLAQARKTVGLHVVAIADLSVPRARAALASCGWEAERISAKSFGDAVDTKRTFVTDDADGMIAHAGIEVIVEATGDPRAGIRFCLRAIEAGKHIVMVNVEADVVAGPLLAAKARAQGVVYSLAYGDQPALICEQVDWARACGFEVVSAGKGTRYHPDFHRSTPETVWTNFGFSEEMVAKGGMNPKMFNSFIDGSKSGIEMTAVSNATGLLAQSDGLAFPPCPAPDLAKVCKPRDKGGVLEKRGTVEVVSSLDRDRRPVPNHLQWGTYVVVAADHEYVRRCAAEYCMLPDETCEHMALYRPIHMIGLEIGISVASAALRGEATGAPVAFNSDVAATAKRPLKAGEVLDGEGGYCVWGKQVPADASLAKGYLPLGLASHVTLKRDIPEGGLVRWEDVDYDASDAAVRVRREMEAAFARPNTKAAE